MVDVAGRTIELVDVGPRDGLQDEPTVVSTADKIAYIEAIAAAGIRRIEVASFVNPKRVPQMADGEAVIAALAGRDDLRPIGLVLNDRGLDRAIATGIGEVNAVVITTDTFSERNQGMSAADALAMGLAVVERAKANNLRVGVTISAAFGCPYEGKVDPERVVELARTIAGSGADEMSLADTIGCAVPTQVGDLVARVTEFGVPVRVHLHNSRNTGFANAVAAVEAGASALDASTGGIGGCPFAPGATGNIAMEDLVYLLDGIGVSTGVDLPHLLDAVNCIEQILDRKVPGMMSKAGLFPRPQPV